MTFSSIRRSRYVSLINSILIVAFVVTMIITPRASYAQGGVPGLPEPGSMVNLSPTYVPLMITGLTVHPENPLLMDFIVSTGNSRLNATQVKEQSNRLIKYFLACLTIPENDQWVNLSPYEKQRIVPEDLGQTVLGQDMLAQDYLLKQLTASLIYPEKNLGKSFWDKIYAKASEMYGTTKIPVNTFNKVWILPDTAKVFTHNNTVFVVKSHLKVMLDEDYLALVRHSERSEESKSAVNDLGNKIIRQIILPAIEQEVNTGKNFSNLRQIYNSMILAVWFKKNLKEALLNQVYSDRAKVSGVNADDPAIKEKIYQQYLQAYKKGVFNYIKEETDPNTRQITPRKYFSGGLTAVTHVDLATLAEADAAFMDRPDGNKDYAILGQTQGANGNSDAAMAAKGRADQAMINYNSETIQEYIEGITIIQRNLSPYFGPIEQGVIKTYVIPGTATETKGINLWEDTKNLGFLNFTGIYLRMYEIIQELNLQKLFEIDLIRDHRKVIKQLNIRFHDPERNKDNEQLLTLARTVFNALRTRGREYLADLAGRPETLAEGEIIRFAERLSLSPEDTSYVAGLFRRSKAEKAPEPLKIGQNFIPTALMTDRQWAGYPEVDYTSDIKSNTEYASAADHVVLLAQPMDVNKPVISDLRSKKVSLEGYDALGNPIKVEEILSVLEIKILRFIHMAGSFQRIDLQELVSSRSKADIDNFLNTKIYLDDRIDQRPGVPKRTYRQMIEQNEHTTLKDMLVQPLLPTINITTGRLTDRLALAGHGYWGTTSIHDITDENIPSDGMSHMRVLYNGDDPNNFIDPNMAGFMVKEGVGFAILTTTRMPNDTQGGILGVEETRHGTWRPSMMEFREAQNVSEVDKFQEVGRTQGESKQRFNTNTVILNASLLQPFLRALKEALGKEKFEEITAPNLILDPELEQRINKLEGALGHVLLNLNAWITTNQTPEGEKARALLKQYGIKRLLTMIDLGPNERADFFTPNKSPIDQVFYNSDRFEFDKEKGALINAGPAQQPGFNLDEHVDIDEAFKGTSFREFTGTLTIKGDVRIPNAVLLGDSQIRIINETGQPRDLNDYKGQLVQHEVTLDGNKIILDRNYTIYLRSDGAVEVKYDQAMTADEYIHPVVTVPYQDFFELVKARQRGEAGISHNVEKRTLIPPSTDIISKVVVQWADLPEAQRVRLVAQEAEMFRKGQVAAIIMAGGEATRYGGPKAFKEVTPQLGEFLGIKADNLRWFNKNFGVEVPLFLLSSQTRIESFKEQLAQRNYYGLKRDLFKWYVQGSVDTFIPTDEEIDTLSVTAEMKTKYKKFSMKLRTENPDGIYRFQGKDRLVVPGHLDAVSAFIVSGRLAEALEMGIEYLPVFNIDNLQAILKNQGLYAHFAQSGADFGFILAEKNLTFSFKDKSGQRTIPKILVRFRDNVLSFDDVQTFQGQVEKDGYRYVINQTAKTVDVYDVQTGQKMDVGIEIKPETGGTLVQYEDTGEAIMKEGFELPSNFPHVQAPFFNTNTVILRAKSLLRILGLPENEQGVRQLKAMTFEGRSELVREKIVRQVKANFEAKEHVVEGEFPEYGVVGTSKETGKKETRIPVSQVTRIMLQVAHLPGVKVQYYFLPRSDVFAPVKTPDDARPAAENSRDDLEKYTLRTDQQKQSNPAMTATAAVLPRVNPTKTKAWLELYGLAFKAKLFKLANLFKQDPQRAERMSVELNPQFRVDFSKNLVDQKTLDTLIELAREVGLQGAIEQMFNGEKVNETEGRAVLHTALRNVKRDPVTGKLVAVNGSIYVDDKDVMPGVIKELEKMETFTKKVQSGKWKGASGKRIKNIINVGIGGSDLGPKMAVEALRPYKAGDVNAYFVSNVDPMAIFNLFAPKEKGGLGLDPEKTMVVIASKTFKTAETINNADTIKQIILDHYKSIGYMGDDIIKKHFVAVSTATELVKNYGIDPQNMFEFWDWAGGRYSMWSDISLSLAVYAGFDNFLEFLQGAVEADDHFRTQPFENNIPVLKAIISIWNSNFLGFHSVEISPYAQNLSLFPDYLQQAFMESNGKGVDRNGKVIVTYQTSPIIWGRAGSDSQHSYRQLLAQGTRIVPVDFIIPMKPYIPENSGFSQETINRMLKQHQLLVANAFAQASSLAFGEHSADPYTNFPGNRPSTSVLIKQITPRTLGSLIALYEHQIFVEGVILNVFSFDQPGVELAKREANKLVPALEGEAYTGSERHVVDFYHKDNQDKAMTALPENILSIIHKGWSWDYGWDVTVVKNVQDWYASHAVNDTQRQALLRIISEGKADKIKAGFTSKLGVLQPGTAGTRGEMENLAEDKIGANYFSSTTVIQYTLSFVNWYKSTGQTGPAFITKEVRENSDTFGDIASRILLANGIPVVRINKPVSTPFASYLAKWLGKSKYGKPAFGYQISASHNKFADNGIKFMGPDGQQFMPEVMDPIAKGIPSLTAVGPMPDINLEDSPLYHVLSNEEFTQALNAYFDEIDSTLAPDFKTLLKELKNKGRQFVFTPLNGASGEETILYLDRLGLEEGVHYLIPPQEKLVPTDLPADIYAQKRLQSSDPANDKVLQAAREYAEQHGINMVIARDPDGDRLVLAMKINGEWKKLDGNQNAIVMLHDRLSHSQDLDKSKMLVMRSHATTTLLDKIASAYSVKILAVPVGFKYFGAKVIQVFNSFVGRNYFGAEESFGTSNGHINEKDGLSGLVNMLIIVARLEKEKKGRNIFDYLYDIYMKFGYPGDRIVNIELFGPTKPEQDKERDNVKAALKELRIGGTFAGFTIVSFKDEIDVEGLGQYHDGYDFILKDKDSGKEFRLLFRASGTEAIFKAYFSWQEPITSKNMGELQQIIFDTDKFVGKKEDDKDVNTVTGRLKAAFEIMAGDKAMSVNSDYVDDSNDEWAPAIDQTVTTTDAAMKSRTVTVEEFQALVGSGEIKKGDRIDIKLIENVQLEGGFKGVMSDVTFDGVGTDGRVFYYHENSMPEANSDSLIPSVIQSITIRDRAQITSDAAMDTEGVIKELKNRDDYSSLFFTESVWNIVRKYLDGKINEEDAITQIAHHNKAFVEDLLNFAISRKTGTPYNKKPTAAQIREAGKAYSDSAMKAPGGIDLNSRNLKMESSGQKVDITFDPAMIAQFKRGDFSGVRIQILDVVPINIMPLLGLKEDEGAGAAG